MPQLTRLIASVFLLLNVLHDCISLMQQKPENASGQLQLSKDIPEFKDRKASVLHSQEMSDTHLQQTRSMLHRDGGITIRQIGSNLLVERVSKCHRRTLVAAPQDTSLGRMFSNPRTFNERNAYPRLGAAHE